jgi:hypothetical protein
MMRFGNRRVVKTGDALLHGYVLEGTKAVFDVRHCLC